MSGDVTYAQKLAEFKSQENPAAVLLLAVPGVPVLLLVLKVNL